MNGQFISKSPNPGHLVWQALNNSVVAISYSHHGLNTAIAAQCPSSPQYASRSMRTSKLQCFGANVQLNRRLSVHSTSKTLTIFKTSMSHLLCICASDLLRMHSEIQHQMGWFCIDPASHSCFEVLATAKVYIVPHERCSEVQRDVVGKSVRRRRRSGHQ